MYGPWIIENLRPKSRFDRKTSRRSLKLCQIYNNPIKGVRTSKAMSGIHNMMSERACQYCFQVFMMQNCVAMWLWQWLWWKEEELEVCVLFWRWKERLPRLMPECLADRRTYNFGPTSNLASDCSDISQHPLYITSSGKTHRHCTIPTIDTNSRHWLNSRSRCRRRRRHRRRSSRRARE